MRLNTKKQKFLCCKWDRRPIFNKKAQFEVAEKSIFWLLAGVLVTIMLLVFTMLVANYRSQITRLPAQLEAESIALRFVNTPECFTYQDSVTGRVYPGTIDVSKYLQSRLDSCYRTEPEKGFKDYNFGIVLEGFNIDENGTEELLRTNNFFNKVDFTLYKNVLVKSGNSNTPTRMIIYVQRKI
tara:strand:+ start:91 stop:639 length:549 start_codon:yes stop_codon:yes gene_type:complete